MYIMFSLVVYLFMNRHKIITPKVSILTFGVIERLFFKKTF